MYIITFMINWTITCCRIACHYKQVSSSEILRNLGTNFIGSNNVTLLFYITFKLLCYTLSVIAFHWYNMIQLIYDHFGKTLRNKELWSPAVQRLVQKKKRKRAWGCIGHMLRRTDTQPRGPQSRTHRRSVMDADPSTPVDKNGRVIGETAHMAGSKLHCSNRTIIGQPIFQQAQINPLVTNILFI